MIGDRYRYKESSICRVVSDPDPNGCVLVYWEGDDFVTRVDVNSSVYQLLDEDHER